MEEAEWAVETCKATGKPTAVSLCIGPQGDLHGIPTGECAVRLAHAGIDWSDSRILCTKNGSKIQSWLQCMINVSFLQFCELQTIKLLYM